MRLESVAKSDGRIVIFVSTGVEADSAGLRVLMLSSRFRQNKNCMGRHYVCNVESR